MSRDRRTEIIIQAGRTFLECGYDATSMNLVAERCKVTKPGLYYHFDGKQALLFAIMSYAMDELESGTESAVHGVTSPHDRLRAMITTHARLITTIMLTSGTQPADSLIVMKHTFFIILFCATGTETRLKLVAG